MVRKYQKSLIAVRTCIYIHIIHIYTCILHIQVLEKKEWKTFRTMVTSINNRQLRRCGKKLPRYCDINNDRRISMTEWLSCLNAQRPTTGDTIMFYAFLYAYS